MSVVPPNVRPPTLERIREIARRNDLTISDDETKAFENVIRKTLKDFERMEEMTSEEDVSQPDRSPGYTPDEAEDPYNAFVTKCRIQGSGSGSLESYDVGIKDMIAVAGIRMTCGSRMFDHYVPSYDATIVTRLLDAGATIVGKTTMEGLAVSASGDQAASGPVLNPHDPEYLSGGSSNGSAVAVATGDVDLAIGTDQAGSIRIPAAMCGCVGFKPTFGLVPYTGIFSGGPTIDHAGPLTRTVEDCARSMEVIAGRDPEDPRQRNVAVADYTDEIASDGSTVSVGVLDEGFGRIEEGSSVDEAVLDSLESWEAAGADVRQVSVPDHLDAPILWRAISTGEGVSLIKGEGVPRQLGGFVDEAFAEVFARGRRVRGKDLPLNYKLKVILGEYLLDEYSGRFHAKAQRFRSDLVESYDAALGDVDVLAMPTVPLTALESREISPDEFYERSQHLASNTCPFNVTGHPAISIPCGTVDGLPVGLMLVGQRGQDSTVLSAAKAFERDVGGEH